MQIRKMVLKCWSDYPNGNTLGIVKGYENREILAKTKSDKIIRKKKKKEPKELK